MFEVKEKPKRVERALLVGALQSGHSMEEVESLLAELKELTLTIGIAVVDISLVRLRSMSARFFLGKGKMAEILQKARDLDCDCIIFDNELTPGQQRNWEKESGLCVIDRHEVILDIFAQRAQTKEAVLQVDLARMQYSLPRLKRAWTHLDRQRGGGGVTQRGEGEAQIEIDQRLVRKRIAHLKNELALVMKHRAVQRSQRLKVPMPTAAIVGYTNAGKSTLLNSLTKAGVLVEDKLFATLDPTTRRLELPSGRVMLLTDTVGFVRNLPHHLVDAFKATLEEAVMADFLIHIIDVSSPDRLRQAATTLQVLKELGAEEKRIVTLCNKIDLIDGEDKKDLILDGLNGACFVSLKTGEGLETLLNRLEEKLDKEGGVLEFLIPHDRYDLRHRLHEMGCVLTEKAEEEGVRLHCNLPARARKTYEPYRQRPKNIRKIGAA